MLPKVSSPRCSRLPPDQVAQEGREVPRRPARHPAAAVGLRAPQVRQAVRPAERPGGVREHGARLQRGQRLPEPDPRHGVPVLLAAAPHGAGRE